MRLSLVFLISSIFFELIWANMCNTTSNCVVPAAAQACWYAVCEVGPGTAGQTGSTTATQCNYYIKEGVAGCCQADDSVLKYPQRSLNRCSNPDPCMQSTCLANGACQYTPLSCTDYDSNTFDYCEVTDPVLKTFECRNVGKCTKDFDCYDPNTCLNVSCVNGFCVKNDTCFEEAPSCYTGFCLNKDHCQFSIACSCKVDSECPNNDGDPCTTARCENGQCVQRYDLALCACRNSGDCNNRTDWCTDALCSNGVCTYTKSTLPLCCNKDSDCDDSDPSTFQRCYYSDAYPPVGFCQVVGVNKALACANTTLCNDQDACSTETCTNGVCNYNLLTGGSPCACWKDSDCPSDSCHDGFCLADHSCTLKSNPSKAGCVQTGCTPDCSAWDNDATTCCQKNGCINCRKSGTSKCIKNNYFDQANAQWCSLNFSPDTGWALSSQCSIPSITKDICEDLNTCSIDSCTASGQCSWTKNTADSSCCSANSDCPAQDACHVGQCQNFRCVQIPLDGPQPGCTNSNPCTVSACYVGSCRHTYTAGCCQTANDCNITSGACTLKQCINNLCSLQLSTASGCCDPYITPNCQMPACPLPQSGCNTNTLACHVPKQGLTECCLSNADCSRGSCQNGLCVCNPDCSQIACGVGALNCPCPNTCNSSQTCSGTTCVAGAPSPTTTTTTTTSSTTPTSTGPAPTPTPCLSGLSCYQVGKDCGTVVLCQGGVINCGTCSNGLSCVNNSCICSGSASSCCSETCASGVTPPTRRCGTYNPTSAQCAGVSISCGSCGTGQYCNNGFCANIPGNSTVPSCTAKTCLELGYDCGEYADNCGGLQYCGTCSGTCINNVCQCQTLTSCAQFGWTCGYLKFNGCGQEICGYCSSGSTCTKTGLQTGGQCCSTSGCVAINCTTLNAECGIAVDGYDNQLNCGSCSGNNDCVFNKCVAPTEVCDTCFSKGYSCGIHSRVCTSLGNSYDCGSCSSGFTCDSNGQCVQSAGTSVGPSPVSTSSPGPPSSNPSSSTQPGSSPNSSPQNSPSSSTNEPNLVSLSTQMTLALGLILLF